MHPQQKNTLLSTPKVNESRSDPPPIGSGPGKTFIFAVSNDLQVHVAPDSERAYEAAVKHETLFHNADVLAAGEICIEDGIIVGINDFSGSYVTDGALENDPEFSASVIAAFDSLGLPVGDVLRQKLETPKGV